MYESAKYCQQLQDRCFALRGVSFGTLQPAATKQGGNNGEKGDEKKEEKRRDWDQEVRLRKKRVAWRYWRSLSMR